VCSSDLDATSFAILNSIGVALKQVTHLLAQGPLHQRRAEAGQFHTPVTVEDEILNVLRSRVAEDGFVSF